MSNPNSGGVNPRNITPSATATILGLGLSLAFVIVIARFAIVAPQMTALGAYGRVTLMGRAVVQDLIFIAGIVLLGLIIAKAVPSPRRRRLVGIGFGVFCLLILFWHMANVIVVEMLGEPLTLSWLLYSDLMNSTYAFEAILNFATLPTVALFLGTILAFLGLSYALARFFERRITNRRALVPSAIFVGLLISFGFQPTANSFEDRARFANPVLAFAASISKPGRVTAQDRLGPEQSAQAALPPIARTRGEEIDIPAGAPVRNVVLFVMESTAAKYVDGFGGELGLTANLERYSEHGIRFQNIYAHAPASNYSLVSLMAGIVPELSRYSMTYSYPELELETLPGVLRDQGFRTGFFSSSDNRFQDTAGFATRSGFEVVLDHWDWACDRGVYAFEEGADQYLDTASDLCTIPPLLDWIDNGGDTPFFATVWTGMPHYPYYPGEEPKDYVTDPDKNRYLNALRVGDEALAELVEGLRSRGILDETLLVVVGDHGEAFGEHGNYIHARALYQENLHVPLALINPNLFSGESSNIVGGLSDVAPTIFHLLGIPAPGTWQGLSLFEAERPDGVLLFTPWNGFQIGFREGDKKYIYNAHSDEAWLFDLARDPTEKVNLLEGDPGLRAQAQEVLSKWIDLQNAWTDQLIAGTFERPRGDQPKSGDGSREVVVYATGTQYQSAPRGEVRIDGEPIGAFDVTLAPSNVEEAASDYEIDSVITAFQISFQPKPCARHLEVHFLNDEWAGENQTGDTDLYVQSIEINGRRYWPYEFSLLTDSAGGESRFYYRLWRSGGFRINLDLPAECLTQQAASKGVEEAVSQ